MPDTTTQDIRQQACTELKAIAATVPPAGAQ